MPEPSPTRSRIADVDVADPGRPWEALEDLEAKELRLYALGWGDHLPVELDKRIETIRRRKLALEERLLAVGDRAPRSTRISILGSPAFRPGRSVNFARRQQYRRLMRAVMASAGCAAVAMLGLLAAGAGAVTLGGLLLLAAGALGIRARRWLALAGRSRVGAQSEDEVQRALARLEGEGWRLRHSLPWRGPGDIDSIAIAPTGVAFAIETKTRTFDARHLAGVREMALWLHRRRRRWCRRGALPVLCVVRARGLERTEGGVLIVSLDRLVPALRVAAGLSKRPAFLAGA